MPTPGSNCTRGAVQTLFIEKTPPRPESASRTRRLRRRTARFARYTNSPVAVDATVIRWREGQNYPPPVSPSSRQKAWDLPHMQGTYDQLQQGTSDCRSHARLLAAATKESGAWLHALSPVSSLGLRMGDHTTS